MPYSFPQISTPLSAHLLVRGTNAERIFEMIKKGEGDGVRRVFYKRIRQIDKLDFDIEEILDPKHMRSDLTEGHRVNVSLEDNKRALLDIREKLVKVAMQYGYPHRSVGERVSEFDHAFAVELWKIMHDYGMRPVEAAVDGVWNLLQAFLLPSITAWRWEQSGELTSDRRLFGKDRGCFGSLWWRYEVLTEHGNHEYEDWIKSLTQDDFLGIMERPSIRGYIPAIRLFCRYIAAIRQMNTLSSDEKTALVRSATKRLRILAGTVNLWYLAQEEADLEKRIRNIYMEAARPLGLDGKVASIGPA